MNFIVQVANAEELFPWEGLNHLFQNPLPKISNIFPRAFEQGRKIGIIAPHPLGCPFKEKTFDHWSNVGVNIFEMKGICAILRDILDVAHDMMLSFSSVLEGIDKWLDIDKRIDWILIILFHCMHPDVYVTVDLTDWELPQFHLLRTPCLPFNFALPIA